MIQSPCAPFSTSQGLCRSPCPGVSSTHSLPEELLLHHRADSLNGSTGGSGILGQLVTPGPYGIFPLALWRPPEETLTGASAQHAGMGRGRGEGVSTQSFSRRFWSQETVWGKEESEVRRGEVRLAHAHSALRACLEELQGLSHSQKLHWPLLSLILSPMPCVPKHLCPVLAL